MRYIKIEHTILAGRADSTESFNKTLIEHPYFFPDLLDKYGYWLIEDSDERRWILRSPDENVKYVYNLEDLRSEIITIIERQEGISFSTPKKQSEIIDRGAFTGLSEEEIEEEYRKRYEWSKKHNRIDKKIVRETKLMINETKRDYKDVIRIIVVCVFVYVLANVFGKMFDDLPDWVGTIMQIPLILGGLFLCVWLFQIFKGDS